MKQILCLTLLVETSPQALPLGAACIASALKHDSNFGDYQILLEDFSVEEKMLLGISQKEQAEKIAQQILSKYTELEAVLFSVYVWNRTVLEDVSSIIKNSKPDCLTMAGGPEVTANPQTFGAFDYLVCGEGEEAVCELLKKTLLQKTNAVQAGEQEGFAFGIQGVYVKKNFSDSSKIESNEEKLLGCKGSEAPLYKTIRAKTPDTQKLSSPYLDHTIDIKKYGGVLWELARGCPFKCSYCYESKGEKRIQYFSDERLLKELEYFAREKIPQAFVLDPTYNANKKRALEMLSNIKKLAPEMFFYFEARAEFIDKELARAFASVNCSLQFGLQSADPEVLKKVNRSFDKKTFVRNIGFLNQAGAVFGFDLIYGLPGDTYTGFKNSIDFALGLYPNNLELFCLSVLPGTDLYEQATELGLTWQASTPYHVVDSKSFPSAELKKAASLSKACDLFYNQGRAVPWFLSVTHALHQKPSVFFAELSKWMEVNEIDVDCKENFGHIQKFQLDYLEYAFKKNHLERQLFFVRDLVNLNGAISECTACAKESVVKLNYHPDDVMSEYASDIQFFVKNARPYSCKVKVFTTKNGPDYKLVK